jgi:hypothetical protein
MTSLRRRPTARAKTAPAETFAVAPAVAHREVDGMLLVLAAGDEELSAFNETGALVWRGIVRGHPLDRIAGALARRYRIPRAEAMDDVRALVAELRERGLVVPRAAARRPSR